MYITIQFENITAFVRVFFSFPANVDFVLGSGFLRTDKDANSVICCVVSILDDAVNETDETFIAVLTYDPQLSDISPLTVMFEVTVIDNDGE